MATPTSQFTAPSPEVGSQFDLSQVDRNLRQISAVEQAWTLPALPDAVRLDVASMPGVNEDGIYGFLNGLAEDLRGSEGEEEEPGFTPPPGMLTDPIQRTGMQEAQIVLSALSSNPPPRAPTADAVKMFKLRAIEKGLLDMDPRTVDSTWAPELNSVRGELAFDDYNRMLRGDRFGAVPVGDSNHGLMKLLNDFTSPSGLLSAATQLDLFWDFGAISNEFSSWGDKWREVANSDGPLDFAGNLFDALTGPIDDIAIPVLNVGLLFSGIGAVTNSARVGWMGTRALQAADTAGDIYGATRGFSGLLARGRSSIWGERALSAARSNLGDIAEASWTAQKLQKTENFAALGRGMEAWRRALPVRVSKSVIQPGMRMGFASQAEDRLGSYQGGVSLADVSPTTERLASGLYVAGQSLLATPFEVLFTPYNIFRPGTFFKRSAEAAPGVANLLTGGTAWALGKIPGRTAVGGLAGAVAGTVAGDDAGDIAKGAVGGALLGAGAPVLGRGLATQAGAGAAKGAVLGGAAGLFLGEDPQDALFGAIAGAGIMAITPSARAKFLRQHGEAMSNRVLRGLGSAMMRTSFIPLAENQEIAVGFDRGMRWMLRNEPEKLADWKANVDSQGVTKALSNYMGTDDETAAGAIGFMFVSSAIDYIAKAQAEAVTGGNETLRFLTSRNKLIAQLRKFNPEKPTEAVLDEVADALAWTRGGYEGDIKKFHRVRRDIRNELRNDPEQVSILIEKHNEQAVETLHQLTTPRNMPSMRNPDEPFTGREFVMTNAEDFAREGMEGRARIMEAYMPRVRDHFLNFPEFVTVAQEIRTMRADGLLDAAQLLPYRRRSGQLGKIRGRESKVDHISTEINQNMVDLFRPGRVNKGALRRVAISPLAWANESGRATAMRAETKTSQNWAELAESIKDHIDARQKLQYVKDRFDFRAALKKAAPTLDQEAGLDSLGTHQIRRLVDSIPSSARAPKDQIKYLLSYAKRHNLSIAEIEEAVVRNADNMARDTKLWDEFGLDPNVIDDKGMGLFGFDALAQRYKQAQDKVGLTASEIDVPELVAYLNRTGNTAGAAKVQDLADRLGTDGYKLVHGVEFMMPEDLAFGDIFADVTRRHLNAVTLGNFFKGRLPVEALILEDRRQRLALANRLQKNRGKELSPESREVDTILDGLKQFLRDKQDGVTAALKAADRQGIIERTATRLRSSTTPVRLDDLQQRKDEIVPFMDDWMQTRYGAEWTTEDSLEIWRSIPEFRNREFQEMGLYAFEAQARSANQASWALKTASGSKWLEKLSPDANAAQRLLARGRGKRLAGAAVGAAAGRSMESDSEAEGRGNVLLGALAGVAGASVAPALLNRVPEIASFGKLGTLDELAGQADMSRYGYLADNLARFRDSLRFTLSPFFDASRYTEGLMLAQTAAPFRKADGSRLVMPMNMSPLGLKKALTKDAVAEGVVGAKAKDIADEKYDRWIQQFQKFARDRQDFDADALDSTGRWFKQVGILGFSPTDWMGTAFAHLKRQGLDSDAAYRAAREMYTYGVRGRSAAELSANFIFFPFSFQKKALGHLGKWVNQDLGRSILIHDALKTYEILDEKFDLDNYWRDRVPWLQQLQRLNLFAYGVSPGRLGGINSQMFESAGKLAWNMFVPVGMDIKDATFGQEAQDVIRGLVPVFNDINWMIRNAKESHHIVFSESHVTTGAEIRKGYEEWNEFKTNFDAELRNRGYTIQDLTSSPWLGDAKAFYDSKKRELEDKYPAWFESRQESAAENVMNSMERRQRLDAYSLNQRTGEPISVDDTMIGQFEGVLERYRSEMELRTGSRDLTDAPPQVFDEIATISADYARQNPYWTGLWEKFYRSEFGPIDWILSL